MPSLAETHRQGQLAIRAATLADLLKLWPAFDPTRVDETFPAWVLAVSQTVLARRRQSGALAAAYIGAVQQRAGVPSLLVPAGPLDAARLIGNLRIGTVALVKTAASNGVKVDEAGRNAFVKSSGDATRLVLEAGRHTVTQTATADPRARWQRVTGASSCDFCQQLAAEVEARVQAGADFEAHGHCGCTAAIAY
jgi:hypothetical protein